MSAYEANELERHRLADSDVLYRAADVLKEHGHGYDFEAHAWTTRCPYRDMCSGCDARGYCTRMESRP